MKKSLENKTEDRDPRDAEIVGLKRAVEELRSVLAETQAQRNMAQDQAAQFGAIVMAMRRKYESQTENRA
jgi:hypothetical protein